MFSVQPNARRPPTRDARASTPTTSRCASAFDIIAEVRGESYIPTRPLASRSIRVPHTPSAAMSIVAERRLAAARKALPRRHTARPLAIVLIETTVRRRRARATSPSASWPTSV